MEYSCLCWGTTRTRTAWSASGRSPSSSGASAATPQRRSSRCSRYSFQLDDNRQQTTTIFGHYSQPINDGFSDVGFDKCSWQRRQRIHRLPRVSNDDEAEGAGSESGGRNPRGLQSVWQCQLRPPCIVVSSLILPVFRMATATLTGESWRWWCGSAGRACPRRRSRRSSTRRTWTIMAW